MRPHPRRTQWPWHPTTLFLIAIFLHADTSAELDSKLTVGTWVDAPSARPPGVQRLAVHLQGEPGSVRLLEQKGALAHTLDATGTLLFVPIITFGNLLKSHARSSLPCTRMSANGEGSTPSKPNLLAKLFSGFRGKLLQVRRLTVTATAALL